MGRSRVTIFRMSDAKSNAELINMAHNLGYIPDSADSWVLDPTWGNGRFWRIFRPNHLIRADINVVDKDGKIREGVVQADFTAMPWGDGVWDAVVFDPPYKLNGTPTVGGMDTDYGVDTPTSRAKRYSLAAAGMDECYRVAKPGGFILLKIQDQVCSGHVNWMTIDFANLMREAPYYCELVDVLHIHSYREQPPKEQDHAWSNYSSLLVFQKKTVRQMINLAKKLERADYIPESMYRDAS